MASYIPEAHGGFLAYWQLLTAVTATLNTFQSLSTTKLTQRVYAGVPVTGHLSRTFGIWTITSAAIRFASAYHVTDPVVYKLAIASYIFAAYHFYSEWLVFGTNKANAFPSISPLVVSVGSLAWMLSQWSYYIR